MVGQEPINTATLFQIAEFKTSVNDLIRQLEGGRVSAISELCAVLRRYQSLSCYSQVVSACHAAIGPALRQLVHQKDAPVNELRQLLEPKVQVTRTPVGAGA